MSVANAPTPGEDVLPVWDGRELFVFGVADGGAFDPCANRWRRVSVAGMPRELPRFYGQPLPYQPIVTGERIVVPYPETNPAIAAAIYDRQADQWTTLPLDPPAPRPRLGAVVVWTGREIIVWGGAGPSEEFSNDGARLDPVTGRWSPMTKLGAPSPRSYAAAAWTGSRMVVFSGLGKGDDIFVGCKACGGGLYDPATDAWTTLATEGAPSGATRLFSAGKRVIAGLTGDALFDPEANRWMPSQEEPRAQRSGRLGYAAWVDGNRFVAIGTGSTVRHAAVADLELRDWTPIHTVELPQSPRYGGYYQAPDGRYFEVGVGKLVPGGGLTSPEEVRGGWAATVNTRTGKWEVASLPERDGPPSVVGGLVSWTGDRLIFWGALHREIVSSGGDDHCRKHEPCSLREPTKTIYHREGAMLVPAFAPAP